jgi:hypothetical protein
VTRAYDLAWFWHVPPATVLGCEVADFLAWEAQARRIAEVLGGGGRRE